MQQKDFVPVTIQEEPCYYDSIASEWIQAISGNESVNMHSSRERRIEKVPPLLLRSGKTSKKDYYEPFVVALGPYYHGVAELQEAERSKVTTLQLYVSSTEKGSSYFSEKVHEIVDEARKCYPDGSTDEYDDATFTQMMLLDGCFILYFIECLTHRRKKAMLFNENLGAAGFACIIRDILLLENQLPFIVLKVLMDLKFEDGGEAMLNTFFNYLNYGELFFRGKDVLPTEDGKQPLHLLELYRASFLTISRPATVSISGSRSRFSFSFGSSLSSRSENFSSGSGSNLSSGSGSGSGARSCSKGKPLRAVKWDELKRTYDKNDELNYMKTNRSFPSVTELKAKGIRFRPTHDESSTDIKFYSRFLYGQLELPRRVITMSSKAIISNMIAYEMSPRNPNDFRVATYIKFMKSLIVHRDDVKELQSNRILIHSLRGDEDVAKMFEEIEVPGVNVFMFNRLKRKIDGHCHSLAKTWLGELNALYFTSPWRTFALFGALLILFMSFLQTFYTVHPVPDKSMDQLIELLKNNCTPMD